MANVEERLATIRVLDSPVVCEAVTGNFTQSTHEELLLIHHDRLVLYDVDREVPEQIASQDLACRVRAATVLNRHGAHGADVLVLVTEEEVMYLMRYEGGSFVVHLTSDVEKDRRLHTSRLTAASDGSAFCRNTSEGVRTIYGMADDTQCGLERRSREELTPMSTSCFFESAHGGALVTHMPCAATSGSIEKLSWHHAQLQEEDRHTCPTSADMCSAQIVLAAGGWTLLIGGTTFTALRASQIDSGDVAGTQTTKLPASWQPVTAADCTADTTLLAEGSTLRILSFNNGSIKTRAKVMLELCPSIVRIFRGGKSAFVADDGGRSAVVALSHEPQLVAADSGPATLLDARMTASGLYLTGGSNEQGHLTRLQYGYEALSTVQVDLGQPIEAATALFSVNTYLVDESAYILVSFPWQSLLLSCTIDGLGELELSDVSSELGIRHDTATLYFGEFEQGMIQVCRTAIVHIAPGHQVRTRQVDGDILLATGTKSMLILAIRRGDVVAIETYAWVKAEASQIATDEFLYHLADSLLCSEEPTALALSMHQGDLQLAFTTAHHIHLVNYCGTAREATQLRVRHQSSIDVSATATQMMVSAPYRSIAVRRSSGETHVIAIRQDETIEEATSGLTWPTCEQNRHTASSCLTNFTGTDADIYTVKNGRLFALRAGDAALHGHLPICGEYLKAQGGIVVDSPFCPSTQIIRPTGLLTWSGSMLSFTTVATEPSYTRTTAALSCRGRRLHVDEGAGLVFVGLDDGERPDLVAYDADTLVQCSSQPAGTRKRKSPTDSSSILAPLFKSGETLYGLVPWAIYIKQDVLSCLVLCLATKAGEQGERGGRLVIVQIKRQGEQVRFKRLLSRLYDAPILAALATGSASPPRNGADGEDVEMADDHDNRLIVSHNYKLEEFILDPQTLKLVSGRCSGAPFRSHVIELRRAPADCSGAFLALTQLDGYHVVNADLQCTHKSARNTLATSCIFLGPSVILTADKAKNVWLERQDGVGEPRVVARLPSVATRLVELGQEGGRRCVACCCLDGSVHLLSPMPHKDDDSGGGELATVIAEYEAIDRRRSPLGPSRATLLEALRKHLRPELAVDANSTLMNTAELGSARHVWQALHSL